MAVDGVIDQIQVLPREGLDTLDEAWVYTQWVNGDLRWLLTPKQQEVYDIIKAALWGDGGYLGPSGDHKRFVLEIARRFGKSFICTVIAIELCFAKRRARVAYGAPTQDQVEELLLPNIETILETCPEPLRPEWKDAKGKLVFRNGSQIKIVGCEDTRKANRMRGPGCDLAIGDEAGFIPVLDYLLRSVIVPMLIRTGGRTLLASTPSESLAHPFTRMCERVETQGNYLHRTAHQSDLTPEQVREFIEECETEDGEGEESVAWQREGLALRVVDADKAIVAEFTPRAAKLTRAVERPKWLAPIVGMDVGFHPDFTAVVFSYWHQELGILVVEDERVFKKATTDQIAIGIRDKELELWGDYWRWAEDLGEIEEGGDHPYQRVSDIAKQLLHDLSSLHSLPFQAVVKSKGDGERSFVKASLNQLKMLIKRGEIAIHPRCKMLISHLKAGVWNNARTSWDRLPGYGHFDFLDALRYQVWHLDRQFDPTPLIDPERSTDSTHVSTRRLQELRRERDGDLEDLADALLPLE